jgi:hypothetical protein
MPHILFLVLFFLGLPTSNLTGALTGHCGGPSRSGMEPGKAMCDHSWLVTLLARSLVKLPIIGAEPRARPGGQ